MTMADAARDANQVTAKLGSYNGTTVALKVEHATGYLKASVFDGTLSAPSVTPSFAARDGNNVPTALGTYNGAVKPLLIQHSSGKLRAVIV